MIKKRPVWFNKDQVLVFERLKDAGLISQKFTDFVKSAFHDKIDSIREMNFINK